MQRVRVTLLIVLLTAVMVGTGTTSAFASTQGKVVAQRSEVDGSFELKFNAGGTPIEAHGHFTYQEPGGYTVKGKVTCYHQEGNRAVFTGPVTKEANPDNNTEAFVIWVADNDASLGGQDAFDVAGIGPVGPNCAENFPLDRFDDEDVQESLYYVTSGNIVVR
jgi:hypothetical protein